MPRARHDPRPPRGLSRRRFFARRWRLWHGLALVALGVLIGLATAPAAHAQARYEWREPGGSVVCSQMPPRPADGVLLRRLKRAEMPAADQARAALQAADAARDALARSR